MGRASRGRHGCSQGAGARDGDGFEALAAGFLLKAHRAGPGRIGGGASCFEAPDDPLRAVVADQVSADRVDGSSRPRGPSGHMVRMGRKRRVDVPDVHIAVDHSGIYDFGPAGIDHGRSMDEVGDRAESAGGDAVVNPVDRESNLAVGAGAVVVVEGGPYKVVAIPQGGAPGRAPGVGVAPDPPIAAVVHPSSIVGGHVGERVIADPNIAGGGHVAPMTVAVGDEIDDDGGPPVAGVVHIDPFAIGGQVADPDGGGRFLPFRFVGSEGEQLGPLAIPGIKGIFLGSVEEEGNRTEVAGVYIGALALGEGRGASFIGVNSSSAPMHGDRGCTLLEDVDANHRVLFDLDGTGRGLKGELTSASPDALDVEHAGPSADEGRRRELDDFGLAPVPGPEEGAASQFNLGHTVAIHPEGIAGNDQGVDGGVAPIIVLFTADQSIAGFIADPCV